MGNLIQGFFGGGSAGAKPISTNSSGTLNTLNGPIRETRFAGGKIAKERQKFAKQVGDLKVIENVKDKNTGEIVTQTRIIKKDRLADIAARIVKKHAGESYASLNRRFNKDKKLDYKDEKGNVIELKFGSRSEEISKRKKFISALAGSDGPTKAEIMEDKKKQRVIRNLNISSINQARDEAEKAMSQKLQDKRKKQSKEQREKERIDKAKVSAGNIKTSSVDIGVERQEGLASVKQEGPSPDRSFGQQEAASITAAIGAKQVAAAEKKKESNVVDMFERVSEMGRKDQPEERSDSFFKDESTDDRESKKAA